MSWFSSANLAELAKTAIKEAQRTIDKALEIPEDSSPTEASGTVEEPAEQEKTTDSEKRPVPRDAVKAATALWGSFSGSFFEPKSGTTTPKEETPKDEPKPTKPADSWSWNWSSSIMDEAATEPIVESQDKEDQPKEERAKSEESLDLEAPQFSGTVLVVGEEEQDEVKVEANVESVPASFEPLSVEIPDNDRVSDVPLTLMPTIEPFASPESIEILSDDGLQEPDQSSASLNLSTAQLVGVESMHSSASGESNLTLLGVSTASCDLDYEQVPLVDSPRSESAFEERPSEDKDDLVPDHFVKPEKEQRVELVVRAGDDSSSSSVDSFVRCEVESENQDSGKSKRSSSISDRSDKCHGGSGHLSTDEGETCTSSDIEIISSPNGDSNGRAPPSPTKVPGNEQNLVVACRSDVAAAYQESRSSSISLASDCHSPPSISAQACSALIPVGSSKSCFVQQGGNSGLGKFGSPAAVSGHQRQASDASSSICSVPESSFGSAAEVEKLLKRVVELTSVLETKENKLVEYSLANAGLMEANCNLQSAMAAEKEETKRLDEEKKTLVADFSQKISQLESKLDAAMKGKEKSEASYEKLKKDLDGKKSLKQLSEELREKDEIIFDLRREGEELSKQQLKLETVIKNLRSKEKENVASITKLKSELEETKKKRDSWKEKLETVEKNEEETKSLLDDALKVKGDHEGIIVKLNSELEDAKFNYESTKTALDAAYKTMEDYRLELQEKKAEILCIQMTNSEDSKRMEDFEKEREYYESQLSNLREQVDHLRMSLDSEREALDVREIELKSEAKELQERLRREEARCETLSSEMGDVTGPLLAQIDFLQSSLSSQRALLDQSEAALTGKIDDLEKNLSNSASKQKSLSDECDDLRIKLTKQTVALSQIKRDLAEKSKEVDDVKAILDSVKEELKKERGDKNEVLGDLRKEVADLEKAKMRLEHELEIERSTLQAEKRKAATLQDSLSSLQQSKSSVGPGSSERRLGDSWASPPRSREDSGNDLLHLDGEGDSSPNETLGRSSPTPSLARLSFADSSFAAGAWNTSDDAFDSASRSGFDATQAGATSVVDILQSQLSRREGEVVQLQREVERWKQQRTSLSDEIMRLSAENEKMKRDVDSLESLKTQFAELQREHNAILQMYGEKVEETEELRMDIHDMKEMYKNQIEELLRKSAA